MAHTPPDGGSTEVTSKGSTRIRPTVITSAKAGTSREMASREKRYAITMGIRTACFVSMIFVSGPLRWVLLAAAVFLPYIAVVLANQANTRTSVDRVEPVRPAPAPQLTTGAAPVEVIQGELVDDDEPAVGSLSEGPEHEEPDDEDWTRRERVA